MFRRVFLLIVLSLSPFTSLWAAEAVVTQNHSTFDVDTLSIKAGDTVVFKNHDDYPHNIQVVNERGEIADRGIQKRGEDIKYRISDAGTYQVRCNLHPKMLMIVKAE